MGSPDEADQDVVLVLAQILGAEPDGAFLFDHERAGAQSIHGDVVGGTTVRTVVERGFTLPVVELDPQERQVVANLFDHQLQAALGQLWWRVVAALQPAVALLVLELPGHVDHVRALVAAIGQRDLASELLLIASEQGPAEEADLRAGVVDVVLALDLEAGGVQHRGQCVSENRAASVADLQRSGRVGRDEFDLDAMSGALIDPAPLVSCVDHGE